ncbi:MAG: hypothetical protein H7039_22990 [Bryobacteraceae bacterium]|nr:hypothetical protein [Bryobacteraceae bacterium]
MVATHMPFRADEDALANLGTSQNPASPSWQAVHVLAAGCGCSRKIAEHLVARGTLPDLQETVVLVGSDPEMQRRLEQAAIRVRPMTIDDAVNRYRLTTAPWLVFVGTDGSVRYAGGYSAERNVRDGYQDARLWNTLRMGGSAQALPAFGCATGRELQKKVDPLGFKYRTGV